MIECSSFIIALDLHFKSFFIFNLQYRIKARNVLLFFETCYYNMKDIYNEVDVILIVQCLKMVCYSTHLHSYELISDGLNFIKYKDLYDVRVFSYKRLNCNSNYFVNPKTLLCMTYSL